MNKVTKHSPPYPTGCNPDIIVPADYKAYRFALGKKGTNPFVAICMNPSAAKEETSDMTINRIIKVGNMLNYDGWMVFNTYPERATSKLNLEKYNSNLSEKNINVIKEYLLTNNIKEVWGAWGNDDGVDALIKGKEDLLNMLKGIGVRVFYFGTLKKRNNPRHPLQRQEKNDYSIKRYL